jgi:hypothetical protein
MSEIESVPYTAQAILWGRGEMKTKVQACLNDQMALAVRKGDRARACVIWDMRRIIDDLDLSFGGKDKDND